MEYWLVTSISSLCLNIRKILEEEDFFQRLNFCEYILLCVSEGIIVSTFLEKVIFFAKPITHFIPLVSFYTPWKHQETESFSDIFRGYRMRPVAWNGLVFCCIELSLFRQTIPLQIFKGVFHKFHLVHLEFLDPFTLIHHRLIPFLGVNRLIGRILFWSWMNLAKSRE